VNLLPAFKNLINEEIGSERRRKSLACKQVRRAYLLPEAMSSELTAVTSALVSRRLEVD
jgi:hypothetical protein